MRSNKCLWYERMWSSRIKKNSGRSGIDIKRIEHDFWFRKRRLCRHIIHLSYVGFQLLITILPLWGLLAWLLRAIIRQVTFFTTMETLARSVRGTSLHRSIVRRSLSWCLLTTLLLRTLIGILLLVLVALGYWPRFHWLGGPWYLCWKPCWGLVCGWVLLLEAYPWSLLFLASISSHLLSITIARFTSVWKLGYVLDIS